MVLAVTLLLLSLTSVAATLLVWSRRTTRGFLRINPARRAWLRSLHLAEPADFLRLEALIVSGHIGRQVGRLTLGEGPAARVVYIKRESQVGWLVRLKNFLAGCGWVSRCVREADVLQALERDALPAPRWLATGEDGRGGAFLLIEEVGGAEPLAAVLPQLDGVARRQLAIRLGRLLARLHGAGFFHRDLYAKHVLVQDQQFCLLDWQRAWRGARVPYLARVRDLATLHATLAEPLASPRDRLVLVRAYAGAAAPRPWLRALLADIEEQTRQLRQRRHIREKRQPPAPEPQNWICLDGEGLCITPAMALLSAGQSLDWLRLDQQPTGSTARSVAGWLAPTRVSRRWLTLSGARRALLVRRRSPVRLLQLLRYWLLGQPILAPEQRQATLLWRLERHGVPAPRVLGFGRRLFPWRSRTGSRASDIRPSRLIWPGWQDAFLLCEPYDSTVRLSSWLAYIHGDQRGDVLHQLGQLLARLHEACCYLNDRGLDAFAVQLCDGEESARLVLAQIEGIQAARRPNTIRAGRDLARLHAFLSSHGATLTDWRTVLQGHADAQPLTASGPVSTVRYETSPAEPWHDGPAEVSADEEAHTPTATRWQQLVRGWCRLRQHPAWSEFAGPAWADRIMQVPVTDRYNEKQGRSTGRWRLRAKDGSGRELVVYLKRHYQLAWWRRVLALLWPGRGWSPAFQEYEHLQWAHRQGVPVPATAAAGEFIGPWGRLQSFLAVEELTGMLPLDEALPLAARRLPPEQFRRWKRGLAGELARITRLLHDRRHFHKDLYLCHFFIAEGDTARLPGDGPAWRGRVYLIDLHRLAHHPWTWWRWRLKDLAQLLYSADLPCLDVRDKLAFWMQYRGLSVRGWTSRVLRFCIVFKWRRYQRHNCRSQLPPGQAPPARLSA